MVVVDGWVKGGVMMPMLGWVIVVGLFLALTGSGVFGFVGAGVAMLGVFMWLSDRD